MVFQYPRRPRMDQGVDLRARYGILDDPEERRGEQDFSKPIIDPDEKNSLGICQLARARSPPGARQQTRRYQGQGGLRHPFEALEDGHDGAAYKSALPMALSRATA